MSLLQQAPRFDVGGAARFAREHYGLDATASTLASERDQNFLVTTAAGERFVLKIANATESRAMLDAQNAAMAHLAERVSFCPRVVPTLDGRPIADADGFLVRLVTYLDGVPLATVAARPRELLESFGRTLGRLDAALSTFDHPAIHRDFHWDLANAPGVIGANVRLIADADHRALVARVSETALRALEPHQRAFRRAAVHHDANDWNVLVGDGTVTGIIDFGDMVHSWIVADPAVAIAYAMLETPDPVATAAAIVRAYDAEHPLEHAERAAVLSLAMLRLCMSACIAAAQQQERPDDEYLTVSQEAIRRILPRLADLDVGGVRL